MLHYLCCCMCTQSKSFSIHSQYKKLLNQHAKVSSLHWQVIVHSQGFKYRAFIFMGGIVCTFAISWISFKFTDTGGNGVEMYTDSWQCTIDSAICIPVHLVIFAFRMDCDWYAGSAMKRNWWKLLHAYGHTFWNVQSNLSSLAQNILTLNASCRTRHKNLQSCNKHDCNTSQCKVKNETERPHSLRIPCAKIPWYDFWTH